MKTFVLIFALGFFFSVLCSAHAEGDDFSKEVVKATPLTSSVYMLEGAGGNMTAYLSKDGVLLVDDDFAPMAEKLLGKLKELGGTSPSYIVNTHFHYDHTGGNEVFGSTATIISATETRDRLMHEQTLWKKQHPAEPPRAWPDITFSQSLTLHLDDEQIRLQHFPHAHTDGDTVAFFKKAKIVSMGDLYFSGMYPIFHPEHDGSLTGYILAIEKVLAQIPDDARIVPGHGPLSTKKELTQYHEMILASVAVVKRGIKNGNSLQQIQKAGLPKQWEPFSHGYLTTDRWLALVFESLRREK